MIAISNVVLAFVIIANVYYAHATHQGDHERKGHLYLGSAAIVTALQIGLFIWGP